MNEKFKLLALEAQMGTADFDAGSYYVATPDKMQKLCELIVRECIEQVITGPNGPAHYAVEAALRLKKHFGVEE
jgi:hypothetical protein